MRRSYILIFPLLLLLSGSLMGCAKESIPSEEIIQNSETESDTVIGSSGKRYVMKEPETESTQSEEYFGSYSELQRVLKEIAEQTKPE